MRSVWNCGLSLVLSSSSRSFFFSSRRRHTRSKRDWSSDVCSSDLINSRFAPGQKADAPRRDIPAARLSIYSQPHRSVSLAAASRFRRVSLAEPKRAPRSLIRVLPHWGRLTRPSNAGELYARRRRERGRQQLLTISSLRALDRVGSPCRQKSWRCQNLKPGSRAIDLQKRNRAPRLARSLRRAEQSFRRQWQRARSRLHSLLLFAPQHPSLAASAVAE